MAAAVTESLAYVRPGLLGSKVTVKPRYDNFIGGAWVPPFMGNTWWI